MNIKEYFDAQLDRLWHEAADSPGFPGRRGLRLLVCTARELGSGELTLRAMSLVYTTLLSLVPLLALAFAILKGLGVHNRIEPMLGAMLEPLGPSAASLTSTVIGFVDNVKIGVLGSIGIALLFYTALNMIQKVESSFNFIWKIPRQRPLAQRVSEYLVVLLLGPLALSLVLGATASFSSNQMVSGLLEEQWVGQSVFWLGRLLPYLLIIGIFSFLFAFIPNTRVRLKAALGGGLISGLLWQSAAWVFANFVASSGNYNAVYSSFAIVILLLIWLYLAWVILLTGCQLAFFIQHPEYQTRHRRHASLSGHQQDLLLINLLSIVQQRFHYGRPGLSPGELARLSASPPDLVNPLIDKLIAQNILVETNRGRLLPGQDLGPQNLADLLRKLNPIAGNDAHGAPALQQLSSRLEQARSRALEQLSLASLLELGSDDTADTEQR